MGKIINQDTKEKIGELLKEHSVSEIASLTGVSIRSIFKIQRELNIVRKAEELRSIRSRIRKNIVNAERRRILFGTDQKTKLKVNTNKQRIRLRYKMKRIGYKNSICPNEILYDENTKRNLKYEDTASLIGMHVKPA